jgi:hypothetical protein
MNSKIKFHSPNGPAFLPRQRWVSSSGTEVEILSTARWGNDKWMVDVTYCVVCEPEQTWQKDAWNFQVRYTHQADLVV